MAKIVILYRKTITLFTDFAFYAVWLGIFFSLLGLSAPAWATYLFFLEHAVEVGNVVESAWPSHLGDALAGLHSTCLQNIPIRNLRMFSRKGMPNELWMKRQELATLMPLRLGNLSRSRWASKMVALVFLVSETCFSCPSEKVEG
jgi:hypothetical protein